MGVPVDPTCDVCGTAKQSAPGIGTYCPNNGCGDPENSGSIVVSLEDDRPPTNGKFVKLSSRSVQIALEEKLRAEQPMLDKIRGVDLFGVLVDGTPRKLTEVMLQVRHPKPDRRPGATRITTPSERHPKGVVLRLASREGVSL